MRWRNGPDSFGLVTRLLHWGMALLVAVMIGLGKRIEAMEPGLANLWLYGLHKSLGLAVLALVVLRLVWHRISPPPRPVGGGWQALAARGVHAAIYLLLLAIPLSGWIASSATGIDILFLDRWGVPAIAPVSAALEEAGFEAHEAMANLLLILLLVHVGAAFKREVDGDGTLKRMVTGRR
ncbi:MAG: hypothetical protein RIR62_152 [Pseudomonadota bacterium]|jgi:cytochrome b561